MGTEPRFQHLPSVILNVAVSVDGSAIGLLEYKLSKRVSYGISRPHSNVEKTSSSHVSHDKHFLLTWTYCPARVQFHVCNKVSNYTAVAYIN